MGRRIIIPYNPKLKARARKLRNHSTLAEVLLWNQLKGRQMLGYQFLRQKPLDQFIVDFFCYDLMLAIEIDGESHNIKITADQRRQKRLESLGIHFLRFTERDVRNNIEGVLQRIKAWIEEFEHKKSPLEGGQRGV